MQIYHRVTIAAVGLTIIIIAFFIFLGTRKWNVTLPPFSNIAPADYNRICGYSRTWEKSFIIWDIIYRAIEILSIFSSIVCIYISSGSTTLENKYKDILLYSILALSFSVSNMIIKPKAKAISFRKAFVDIKTAIFLHRTQIIDDCALIATLDECERKISNGLME
jgi:hypothetical protein